MRILLDESVPEKLGKLLVGHSCSTVQRQGWTSIKNGKLLALAKDHFDVLLTADKGMEYQQNQDALPVRIVVVRAKTNRLQDLALAVPYRVGSKAVSNQVGPHASCSPLRARIRRRCSPCPASNRQW